MSGAKLVCDLEGEAHLWLATIASGIDPSVLSSWWGLLSEEEKERHDKFLLEEARLRYLAAWALARTSLSKYAEIEPRDWEFERGEYGRPEIARPDGELARVGANGGLASGLPPLRFNLSHSTHVIACLVTLGVDVGVDVEDRRRDLDMVRLADRFFAPEEAADLRALGGQERRRRFFTYWTLKEAYMKACGRGLSIPLRQFSFHIAKDDTIAARFDPELADDESNWQFEVLRPVRNHLLAVAIRRDPGRGDGQDLTVIARRVVPMVEEGGVETLPVVASTRR
jgi:4'-phosphopantetheinyl transferase